MQMLTCATCGGLTPPDASRTCLHCDAPLARPPRWMLRLTSLLGPAGAILLAACYGGPGRYHMDEPGPQGATRMDRDGDGARGPWVCADNQRERCEAELAKLPPLRDVDCDDADRTRYPGAADVDGDGVDQNCDGVDGWRDPNTVAAPFDGGAAPTTADDAGAAPSTIAVPPPP